VLENPMPHGPWSQQWCQWTERAAARACERAAAREYATREE
jgi:hypothetical protein